MSAWGALAGGAVGTIVLTTGLRVAQEVGWTRMDIPLLLGTAFTDRRGRASVIGYAIHFTNGLLFALASLSRTLRELRTSVEQFRAEAVPLVGQLRGTVTQASAELERVDSLLGTAESISATVDSASRLAYLFLANPLVKALAFGAGTTRTLRRLRRSSGD